MNTKNNKIGSDRNMGIELFRIVAMMLICLLHILGRGGVYPRCEYLSINYKIAWFFETIGFCSVNCYALISGFANVKSTFKWRKLVLLWLEVLFITVSTTFVARYAFGCRVTHEQWKRAFLPLLNKEYWYFNAYVLLFPFFPLLNAGMRSLSRNRHLLLIVVMLGGTSIGSLIAHKDIFTTGSGYSTIWLMELYVCGAYFRLYGFPKKIKLYQCLLVFFGCGLVAVGKKILTESLVKSGKLPPDSFWAENADSLISYISPMMVIMAISLLILFGRLNIKGKLQKELIRLLAPATFGVFLVHVGQMGWYHFISGRYAWIATKSPVIMVISIVGITVLFYAGCSCYSLIRVWLFRLCHVNDLVDHCADFCDAKLKKLAKRLH